MSDHCGGIWVFSVGGVGDVSPIIGSLHPRASMRSALGRYGNVFLHVLNVWRF